MHYTNGGKHVGTAEHTLVTADVTCGTCIRTRNYRAAMDTTNAIGATETAIRQAADAGFFTGFMGHNHVISANYSITSLDRFGVNVTYGGGKRISFATLAEFLAWITPLDMTRVIEHVLDGGMTWVAAMDAEWANMAEVADGIAIERDVNDATEYRLFADRSDEELMDGNPLVAEDATTAPVPFRTGRKVKNTRKARRFRRGA